MALERLRDPKTGRFVAGPNSIQNILPAIADDFKQISFSILKLTKLDEEEKKQRKLDDVKQRRDQYAEKYKKVKTSPTRVNKIDKQRSIIDMLKDLFGGIFKFLIVSIGVIGLAKLLASKDVVGGLVSFIKNVLMAAVDVFNKVLGTIGSLLFDKDIQKSFIDLMKNAFEFVGKLLSKGFDLLVGLVKDKDVQGSFIEALIATFQAAYEVIKVGFNILWSSLNENFTSVVQAIVGSIQVIATAIAEGVKFVAEIMSDQRILNSIRDVAVAVFGFMVAAFKEDYLLEGGVEKSGARIFGEWVGEAVALTALLLYWKAKFFKMGLGNFGGGGVDISDIDRRNGPQSKPKPQSKPSFGERFVEKTREYGRQAGKYISDKLSKGYNAVKNSVATLEKYAEKAARYVKVMATNSKVQTKVLTAFSKRFGAAAAARLSAFLAAQAASLAAAPLTAGATLIVNLLVGVLGAYDLYLLYNLLFVSSDGENEDGGIAASIQSDVDKAEQAEKENVKPTPVAAPIANPTATPTANRSAIRSTPAMPESIKNAPVLTSSITPTMAPTLDPGESMVVGNGEFKPYPVSINYLPVQKSKLTSVYGGRINPVTGQYQDKHNGVDLAVPSGTPILAVNSGTITYAGQPNNISGNTIRIKHEDGTGSGYAHLSGFSVKAGDKVVRGQQIGLSGGEKGAPGAGASTGPHLHLVMYDKNGKDVDPKLVIPELASAKSGTMVARAREDNIILAGATRLGEDIKQAIQENVPLPLIEKIQKNPEKAINEISGEVRAAMRMLEDVFLAGRPSFTDLSTTMLQNNTISRPGGNLRDKEARSIQYLLERQVS